MKKGKDLEKLFTEFTRDFGTLKGEIQKAIVGYDELITESLVAIFSQGHVLLEGVPGLGKTYLVRVISEVLGLDPGRVQCTPDLMPADILGTHILNEDENGRRVLHFEKGPVFKNLILVDEINRATPKTQAALLEVMQEHTVTAGGERHELPEPFFVMATQNPMEMEGTYPLPEAQLDRFMFKIRVHYPSFESLVEISKRTTGAQEVKLKTIMSGEKLMEYQGILSRVPVADPITEYAAKLILATHPEAATEAAPEAGGKVAGKVGRYVSYGASPRGLQALVRGARVHTVLDGRSAVSVEDVKLVTKVALRHRVILNFEGEAESVDIDQLLDELIEAVPTPAQEAG
ncbi:MAG: AAA family ATPase [Verrucomicrobiales bacterium]